MENLKIKKNKIGRLKYIPNLKQLKELYKKIESKEITNEERLANSRLWQNKMVWIKEKNGG